MFFPDMNFLGEKPLEALLCLLIIFLFPSHSSFLCWLIGWTWYVFEPSNDNTKDDPMRKICRFSLHLFGEFVVDRGEFLADKVDLG